MGTSQRALIVALALCSIDSRVARSQGDAGTLGSTVDPAEDPEADVGDGGVALPVSPPPPRSDDPKAREAWLTVRLGALVSSQPALAGARLGVQIVDLDDGKILFSRNPDVGLNLASNAKVITAAAALERLGPEFRWRTAAYAEKWDPATGTIQGDLFLRGRGDPTLRVEDVRALIHDLKLAGVRYIEGQVAFDTSYFDDVVEPPHFAEQPKERAGFRAPVGGLSIEGNSIVVVVEPDPAGIFPAEVTVTPSLGEYVEVVLADVATVTRGRNRIRVETKLVKEKNVPKIELEVTGQIRADNGPEWIRRRIDDPVRMAHEIVRRALAVEGIEIKKKYRRATVPPTARLMAFHDSAPLGDVVRTMNKVSNNFIAETILKTLGAESGPAHGLAPRPATWADGLAAVHAWLVERVGLEEGRYRFGNGSGLFSSTEVSPAQLVKVLDRAWRDFRVGPDLAASLPIMGVDGTTRSRLVTTAARGRARAKTGTLAAVSTLAGYVAVDSRRTLGFAILLNDIPPGARRDARALQDAIVEACVLFLGGT